MGDSFKAIADDEEDYAYLCKKWGTVPHKDGVYGDHNRWLNLLDEGKTRESFLEYQKRMDIDRLKSDISEKKKELSSLEKKLNTLINVKQF